MAKVFMTLQRLRAVAVVLARMLGSTGTLRRQSVARRIAGAALARVTGRWRWLRWLVR